MYTDDYSKEEFNQAYETIKEYLTTGITPTADCQAVILGGQPGAGKSTFYTMKDDLKTYVAINGDEYRRFHPNAKEITQSDPEHYAERTQKFSNQVVEKLIEDLSNNRYNLIIEGTLRTSAVPIRTCEALKEKGYGTELVVVACDAGKAWESTIMRAEQQKERGIIPRIVPIDIYDRTVHQIADSLTAIEDKACFDNILIMDRDGIILFDENRDMEPAGEILANELNLNGWEEKFPLYEKQFIREKIDILEMTLGSIETIDDSISIHADDILIENEEQEMDDDLER